MSFSFALEPPTPTVDVINTNSETTILPIPIGTHPTFFNNEYSTSFGSNAPSFSTIHTSPYASPAQSPYFSPFEDDLDVTSLELDCPPRDGQLFPNNVYSTSSVSLSPCSSRRSSFNMSDSSAGSNRSDLLAELRSKSATPDSSSTRKKKASHTRKTEPGHIKRPPNAFILFRTAFCTLESWDHAANVPGMPPPEALAKMDVAQIKDHRYISRITGHLWRSLPKQTRAYWDDQAQKAKELHQQKYPEYKYRPVSRDPDAIRRRRGQDEDKKREKDACLSVAKFLAQHSGNVVEENAFPTNRSSLEVPYSRSRKFSTRGVERAPRSRKSSMTDLSSQMQHLMPQNTGFYPTYPMPAQPTSNDAYLGDRMSNGYVPQDSFYPPLHRSSSYFELPNLHPSRGGRARSASQLSGEYHAVPQPSSSPYMGVDPHAYGAMPVPMPNMNTKTPEEYFDYYRSGNEEVVLHFSDLVVETKEGESGSELSVFEHGQPVVF